jgi:hypothetical protein
LVWSAGGGGLMAAVLGLPSIQAPKPVSANNIISAIVTTAKRRSARSIRSEDLPECLVLILVFCILSDKVNRYFAKATYARRLSSDAEQAAARGAVVARLEL